LKQITVASQLPGTWDFLSSADSICRLLRERERESGGVARDSTIVTGDDRYFTISEGSQAVLARHSGKGINRV
jgi:hypothetical protein